MKPPRGHRPVATRTGGFIGAGLLVGLAALGIACSSPEPRTVLAPIPTPTAASTSTLVVAAELSPTPASTLVTIEIGSRRQLFVDDFLIDIATSTSLVLHHPRPAEIVLELNDPGEDPTGAYFTVFKDGDLYRMYYRCKNDENETTCYAESRDGIQWDKPSLGIFSFGRSEDTNIVWSGPESHNFAPFRDTNPNRKEGQEYKALGGIPPVAFVSADAIHWKKLREEPVLTRGKFDSQNVAFWDEERGHYVAYFRIFAGVRAIARSISLNFTEWSNGTPIDLGGSPREHLYTNATTPYFRAPDILLAFPSRFQPDRQLVDEHSYPGVSDAVFMSSRDGVTFDRRFLEAFVAPGRDLRNWTERSNMVAWGVVPTAEDEVSVYYTQHFRHPTAHLRRGVLRIDGFVSVNAPPAGGELVTWPLLFSGGRLEVNFETSAVGSLRIELQDGHGNPIEGFTLDDADELFGDDIDRVVTWNGGSDVGAVQGRPVRLRFVMRDADLYSFQFIGP